MNSHPLVDGGAFELLYLENGEGVLASAYYAKLYEYPELMKYVVIELANAYSNKKRKRAFQLLYTNQIILTSNTNQIRSTYSCQCLAKKK